MPDPQDTGLAPAPAPTGAGAIASGPPKRRRYSILTRRDKIVLLLMVGIPVALDVTFIWLPTLASILLSFTNYQGIGGITAANIVGLKNYMFLFTQYTLFWPALSHNLLWLAFFVFIASPIGIFFAVLPRILPFSLKKEMEEDQNIALGIVIGSIVIAMALIIAAAVTGG